MTDEIEQHLGKSMVNRIFVHLQFSFYFLLLQRSLYTQCTNIFTCLDQFDGEKLRQILNGTENEYRLVCTLRLPKGKRPSRTREDVKVKEKNNNEPIISMLRMFSFFFLLLDNIYGWAFLLLS